MAKDADTLNRMAKLQDSARLAMEVSDKEIRILKEDLQAELNTSDRLRRERAALRQSLQDVQEKVEELKHKMTEHLVPKSTYEETTHDFERTMRRF